jgi:hypothetical protein
MFQRIAGISVVLLALAACSKGATSAGSSQPATSAVPIQSPSVATSGPAPVATSAAPPPAAPAGAVKHYECSSVLTDREVQQATGLSDAAFFNQEHGEAIKGQSYCQYFAKQGALSIAVSVDTGPAYDQAFQPLATLGEPLPPVSGLGDWARWSQNMLGVRAGPTGLTVSFVNIGGGSLGISDPEAAAVSMTKLILARL